MTFRVIHMKRVFATLAVAAIVFGATAIGEHFRKTSVKSVSASVLEGKTLLIDPGHGGFDAGASANGAVEKDINLQVAKFLRDFVESAGGAAYMTRESDTDTADPDRSKGITQKKSDLQTRKADIEKYDADLFISIHMNKFEQAEYRGAQVFYDDDSDENKMLAEAIQQAVKDALKDGNKRTAKATGDSIFVLRDNNIPSVLIECGFLSNPEETKLLLSADYQEKLAEGIYTGILKYLSTGK